jgi:hypothetical protein
MGGNSKSAADFLIVLTERVLNGERTDQRLALILAR